MKMYIKIGEGWQLYFCKYQDLTEKVGKKVVSRYKEQDRKVENQTSMKHSLRKTLLTK